VLNKKLLIRVLGSEKLVQRMLYATRHQLAPEPWLRMVRWGKPGCELLVDTSSVEQAYARILAGEEPPRLPSEIAKPTGQPRRQRMTRTAREASVVPVVAKETQ